ncbi:MAG TPA: hypothetical protein VND45_12410, partial [Thermoanaerobaculia bacterium]|nr:hypothetical protein [Thermoanaerobaculia bacterium]
MHGFALDDDDVDGDTLRHDRPAARELRPHVHVLETVLHIANGRDNSAQAPSSANDADQWS